MELQTTAHLQPIKGGGRWLQMVADNTMHLPPRQTPDTQSDRSYFKDAVADLQIKLKNLFFMTRLNLCYSESPITYTVKIIEIRTFYVIIHI